MKPGGLAGASSLVVQLRGLGVSLWLEGERLRYRAPTGALSADLLDRLRSHRDGVIELLRREEIRRVPRASAPRLSFAQSRLWFLDRLEPGSSAYNIPGALPLRGRLDVDALKRCLAEIVRRHESLRTTFYE